MPFKHTSKKQPPRVVVGYKRTLRSSLAVDCSCHRARLRRLFRRKKPFSPPPSEPISGCASLPLELRLEILRFAVEDDEEWHDFDTLQALMLVNRASWLMVAPLFWRVVNLALVEEARLNLFRQYLSVLTLQLVRVVLAVPKKADKSFLEASGKFLSACPNLVSVRTCVTDERDGSGWCQHDGISGRVYSKLTSYELVFGEAAPHTFLPARIDILPPGSISVMLGNLNPDKLTRLCLTSPRKGFGDSMEPFTSALIVFRNLSHLSLTGVESVPRFHLSELALLAAPLRSIHLNLSTHLVRAESLLRYLATYASTIEHFSIFCVAPDNPLGTLHLPKLRHLRLGIPNPSFLLTALLTCPIEVLDLPTPTVPKIARRRADYLPLLHALSPTLRLFLSTQSLVDCLPLGLPSGGIESVVAQLRASGAVVLWRQEGGQAEETEKKEKHEWEEMDVFDRWTRQWRVDKTKAAFLEQEYLADRGLTAEFA